MRRSQVVVIVLVGACMLVPSGTPWAQEALTAKLDTTGLVRVSAGGAELATIELNAHGPGWQHAPQQTATAEVSDLPDQAGKRIVGTLPIPKTEGGAIEFAESVTPLPQGLRLEYDLAMSQTMRLNGLQLSILLPVTQYAGAEVLITHPQGEPRIAGLPQEQQEQTFQIWAGEGARIEVAKATDHAVTIELRAAADIVIQDLRQWENPVFEIRFPAIMEDAGREVTAEDRFHIDLTVTFAAPLQLQAP